MTIDGYDLPGRTFCDPSGEAYNDVRVGVQIRKNPDHLIPADADAAHWELDVTVVAGPDAPLDFSGPAVHGKRCDRFVYLTWGNIDGTDIVISNAAFADIGPAVARIGVPVTEILDEYDALRGAVEVIAERFRAVFERHVWQPFEADGMSPDRIPGLTNDVTQLTELATNVVVTELQERFATFAADYLDRAERPASGDTK